MAATDPQSLMTQGHCFACYGASNYEIMKLALLQDIALAHNPAADVTPQGLLAAGKCLECFGMVSQPKLMELALYQIIAS